MPVLLLIVLLWIAYLTYVALTKEDALKNHLLWLWIGLAVLGVSLPLLGFR